jgi:hypothetical protein
VKRRVTFTGVLEYDPDTTERDPEWCVDVALENGDKHAGYYLFHTGDLTVEDVEGHPGE